MPAELTFTLPANPGCAPLVCGSGNQVFVPLKEASKAKSADGSGFVLGTIQTVIQTTPTSWNYTIEIADTQIADEETITADDVTGSIGCVSISDAALLAKIDILNTP